jgi:hypothetical protein
MRKSEKYSFLLLLLIPAFAFAQSGQILVSMFAIGITILLVVIAITKTKWNKKGKALLLITYFASLVITNLYFSGWPVLKYQVIITLCIILIPIIVIAVNYYLFNNYFKIEK